MTKYQDLRDAFAELEDAERAYLRENENLARLIVFGFRDFLDAPSFFEPMNEDGRTRSYFPFFQIGQDGDSETDEVSITKAITHGADGTFEFAFGIILERGENSFPKRNLIMKVEVTRLGTTAKVKVAGRSVEIPFDGQNAPDIVKVHDMIFDIVMKWLSHRPGDDQKFPGVGFALTKP